MDPDLSLSVSRHHSDSACSGLLPHQRFSQGNMLSRLSSIFPTLGLLESGRKRSNDHLSLSAGLPL